MKEDKFHYVYSAPTEEERREIESIRRQYTSAKNGESKMERLRTLDARVRNSAKAVALTLGIIGCLVFGLGMAMVMEWKLLWQGIVVSLFGGVGMGVAYPAYAFTLQSGKKKYGGEIVALSEELLKK